MEAVMRARGYDPSGGRHAASQRSAFANELNLGANGYQAVYRWLETATKPNHDQTMAMLELVGWLAIPEDQTAGSSMDEPATQLGEVRELRQMMGHLIELLEQPDGAQERPEPRRKREA